MVVIFEGIKRCWIVFYCYCCGLLCLCFMVLWSIRDQFQVDIFQILFLLFVYFEVIYRQDSYLILYIGGFVVKLIVDDDVVQCVLFELLLFFFVVDEERLFVVFCYEYCCDCVVL